MRLLFQIGDSPGYIGKTIDACLGDGAVSMNAEAPGKESEVNFGGAGPPYREKC